MPLASAFSAEIEIIYFLCCVMVFLRALHDLAEKAGALAANKPDLGQDTYKLSDLVPLTCKSVLLIAPQFGCSED